MDTGVKGIADHLEELWSSLLTAVAAVDDEVFQWCPGPEFNSIAILLRHLAGAERWWIGEAIGGIPSHRVRDAEFVHDAPPRAGVLKAVEDARARTRRVLAGLTIEDVQAEVSATVTRGNPPRGGAGRADRPTKLWALLHQFEHVGYHRGQILLLRNLGRKAPAAAR